MKLTTTDDKGLTHIKALVYGDSGIGKTTSILTLKSAIDRTLLCVSERGVLPLRHENFKCLSLSTWEDAREVIKLFKAPEQIEDEVLCGAVKACKILVVDSLSGLHDQSIRQIVTVDKRALATARGKAGPTKFYDEMMQLEDWGLYRSRVMNMVAAYVDLPVHVIFTCLAAWTADRTSATPGLSGKTALEVARHFDLVLHMEAAKDGDGKDTRVWRTFNDGRIIAKDSTGDLDPFEPADWTALFTKILGTKGSKT